jgi:hypothetical protein
MLLRALPLTTGSCTFLFLQPLSLLLNLPLRLLPRYKLVLPTFQFRFRLVIGYTGQDVLELFKLFDHPLVLFYVQESPPTRLPFSSTI